MPRLGRGPCLFDRRLHLGQRTAVIDRHDLLELRQRCVPVVEDALGDRRAGVREMRLDQLAQPDRVEAGHVVRDVDPAVRLEIAALVRELLQRLVAAPALKIRDTQVVSCKTAVTARILKLFKDFEGIGGTPLGEIHIGTQELDVVANRFRNLALDTLEREYSDLDEVWKAEKAAMQGATAIKEELDRARIELDTAHRAQDLQRMSELQYGRIPELEKQLDVDPTESHVLAALSEGSFKKAFGKDRELYLEERRKLLKTLTGLSPGSILPILDFAEQIAADKSVLPDILEIFQAFYRDVMMVLQGRGDDDLVNLDLKETIQRVSGRENIASILDKLEALIAVRRQLDRNVNRQLAVEVLLLKLAA